MNYHGLRKFSAILTAMQTDRITLLAGDNYDVRMAQLLERAHVAIKDDFTRMTLEPGFQKMEAGR